MVTSISILNDRNFGFQIHAYKSGHELLFTTKELENEDQDTVDRLSDISGALRPGEIFEPYFTCYPLPSNNYYVVARTWQDLNAPRSGCVITKSLIINQEVWGSSANVFMFFEALNKMSSEIDVRISTIELSDEIVQTVNSKYLNELTNAIFISKREPTVVFDLEDALYILIRIFSVQWPKLRNRFAACTFSLSQRTIGGRPFDLLFAPGTSKAKFSNWTGRFIEPGSTLKEERVTRLVSASIFENKIPSLFQAHLSKFFEAEVEINEETFRLSLLWSDLSNKLNSDQPYYAILGLLDIANVLPQQATLELYNSIKNNIFNAVQIAPEKLSTGEALQFITSLLLRHKRKFLDRELFHLVHRSVTKISQMDALNTITFLQSYHNPIRKIPSSIYSGIANGLANALSDSSKSSYISSITNPEIGLFLTSTSQEFAEIAVDNFEKNQPDWKRFFNLIFNSDSTLSKSRAAKKITNSISDRTPSDLLQIILNEANEKTFKNVVNKSTLATNLNHKRFVKCILDASLRLNLTSHLLDILFTTENQEFAAIVAIELLWQDPNQFGKIFFDERLHIETAATIVDEIFTDPSEQFLHLLKDSKEKSDFLLNSSVSRRLPNNTIASLLTYADVPLGNALTRLDQLPSNAINSVNTHNLVYFLARAMKNLDCKLNFHLQSLLVKTKKIQVNYLYEAAVHHQNSARRTVGNLEMLFNDGRFQFKLIENIDHISQLLDSYLDSESSQNILLNWNRILKQAAKYKDMQKQAAVIMLNYAYLKAQKDPTILIEAAFPIIYRSFLKGKSIAAAFNSFFFNDWDKCKTLREQLIGIYFSKNWSKFGLLSVAYSADILKEIVKNIAHRKDGKHILYQALKEGKSSPKYNQILKTITKLGL